MIFPSLNQILFIDIETVPEYECFDRVPIEIQQLFEEKTAYQRKDGVEAKDFYEKAGIWAEFGKIICISLGYFAQVNGERKFRTTSFFGEEQAILKEFCQLVETKFHHKFLYFCGHNIKEFDLPYICRRLLIHQMKIPSVINATGKKPWEIKHIDTLELWKFGDYKHYTSLKLLCYVLKIPTPKDDIDGSQVAKVYYESNDIDRIIIYCEKDVLAVAQVLLRMTNQPLIEPHEHQSV